MSKTKRFFAAVGMAAVLTGILGACDHIKSDGSGKAPVDDAAKPKAPQNVMPGGDRYGGGAPVQQ